MGDEAFELIKNDLDVGDIIGATGPVKRTEKGELSIVVEDVKLLTKSLLPLPDKFHGLKDIEMRYRQRYVDMLTRPEARPARLPTRPRPACAKPSARISPPLPRPLPSRRLPLRLGGAGPGRVPLPLAHHLGHPPLPRGQGLPGDRDARPAGAPPPFLLRRAPASNRRLSRTARMGFSASESLTVSVGPSALRRRPAERRRARS